MTAKVEEILGFLTEYNVGTDKFVFGTPQTSPIVDNTVLYKFGHFPQGVTQILPAPTPQLKGHSYQDNRDVSFFEVGVYPMRGKFSFLLMDGTPIYYALGQSNNTTPSYEQHDLTGVRHIGVDKFAMPSFTLHHEKMEAGEYGSHTGGGENLVSEYYGCKVDQLNIHGQKDDWIMCDIAIIASKFAHDNASGMGEVVYPVLTPVAVSPAKGFWFNNVKFSWSGEGNMTEVIGFNIGVSNALLPGFFHQTADEEYAGQIKGRQRTYAWELTVLEDDLSFMTRLLDQTATELNILLERAAGSDHIEFALKESRVVGVRKAFKTLGGEFVMPVFGVSEYWEVEVRDAITAAHYPDHQTPD